MVRRISKPEYILPVKNALLRLGSGSEEEVLDEVYRELESKLSFDDLAILPNGEPRWRNQAQHMIDGLIEDCEIIKKDGILYLKETLRI